MKTKISVEIYKETGKYYTSVLFFSNTEPFESRDQFLEEFKENYPQYDESHILVFTVSADFGRVENKFVVPFQIIATSEDISEDLENIPFEVLVQHIIGYAKYNQYTIEVLSEDDDDLESIEVLLEEKTVIIK